MNNQEDRTIHLMLGYLCMASEAEAPLPRKVEILDRFNLSDLEIATICGCTKGSVRNARVALKKSSKPRSHAKKA
jgi:hypothetical protein